MYYIEIKLINDCFFEEVIKKVLPMQKALIKSSARRLTFSKETLIEDNTQKEY